MMGDRTAEISEYQRAAALGLRDWDLFLNLGLAQLESGDLDAATESLRRAVLFGGNHSESHFDLALAYERHELLADAEREMLASLRLNPGQPDVWNSLGVIYAEEGKTVRAWLVWRELVREAPDYEPARTNLALMGNKARLPVARPRPLPSPRRLPSKPSETNANHARRHLKCGRDRRNQVENKYHGRTSSTSALALRIIQGDRIALATSSQTGPRRSRSRTARVP
jgi:Tfp pilus assembly protein PilF